MRCVPALAHHRDATLTSLTSVSPVVADGGGPGAAPVPMYACNKQLLEAGLAEGVSDWQHSWARMRVRRSRVQTRLEVRPDTLCLENATD